MNYEKALTINETAKALNVTPRSIYYWIEDGTAPKHVKMHGRYLFDKDSVEEMRKFRG